MMPKANGSCEAGNQIHMSDYWKIVSESLSPTMNRPSTQREWSLSCSPIAKNIYPIASITEMLTRSERRENRSITRASTRGGNSAAKNLIEK